MSEITEDLCSIICFATLMQSGKGLIDKSPNYIAEKASMLREGYEAFLYLDLNNKRKVREYYSEWIKPFPLELDEILKSEEDAIHRLTGEEL